MRRPFFHLTAALLCGNAALVLAGPTRAQAAPDSLLQSKPPAPKPIFGLTENFGDFRGQFESLTDPKVIPGPQLTELGDDEEVLGLTVGSQSRAYPARFIAWHHIVNDTLGGRPVAVTYCSVCNTGIAYDPTVSGTRRVFGVFGLYKGVMAMVDTSNDTIYSHLAGEALLGPDKGKTLTALPVLNTTWGAWKKLHPDTTTPAWDDKYRRYYQSKVVSGSPFLPPMFAPTLRGLKDDRLAPNALVLAVKIGSAARAYPFDALAKAPGVVSETLADTPVVIFSTSDPQTGAAFDRRLDGKTLEFARADADPSRFTDAGTSSIWTLEGVCVSGPLVGKHLTRMFSLQSEWYGWSAYFPQTTVYGLPDRPLVPLPVR